MKFSVTITDATAEDLQRLFNGLSGSTAIIQTGTITAADPQPFQVVDVPYTAAPPNTAAVEDDDTPNAAPPLVDKNNLPWDERIHSATKGINADGSWRKKRGVQDSLVAQVEAELRGHAISQPVPDNVTAVAQPVQQPQPVATVPGGPTLPEPPDAVAQPVQQPVAQPVQQPQPVAQPVQQPQPVAAAAPMDYPAFMQRVMSGIQSGTLDNAYIGSVLQRIGAPSITALAPDADKLTQAVQIMQSEGKL